MDDVYGSCPSSRSRVATWLKAAESVE